MPDMEKFEKFLVWAYGTWGTEHPRTTMIAAMVLSAMVGGLIGYMSIAYARDKYNAQLHPPSVSIPSVDCTANIGSTGPATASGSQTVANSGACTDINVEHQEVKSGGKLGERHK